MKNTNFISLSILIFFVFFTISVKMNLERSDWIPLFNGSNLDGWVVHGTEKWYVENNNLVCESGPDKEYGYLATSRKYKNFHLKLEFRQESDGNSGVFFRSSLEGIIISGWQVEVAPPGNDTGGIYESYGRGWLKQIPEEKENILKEGEWNTLEIKVIEDWVTTWLNEFKWWILVMKPLEMQMG